MSRTVGTLSAPTAHAQRPLTDVPRAALAEGPRRDPRRAGARGRGAADTGAWAATRLGIEEAFTAITTRRPAGITAPFPPSRRFAPASRLPRAPPLRSCRREGVLDPVPGTTCSTLTLALFAWWMRRYGWAGLVATALLAVSVFQLAHGHNARM